MKSQLSVYIVITHIFDDILVCFSLVNIYNINFTRHRNMLLLRLSRLSIRYALYMWCELMICYLLIRIRAVRVGNARHNTKLSERRSFANILFIIQKCKYCVCVFFSYLWARHDAITYCIFSMWSLILEKLKSVCLYYELAVMSANATQSFRLRMTYMESSSYILFSGTFCSGTPTFSEDGNIRSMPNGWSLADTSSRPVHLLQQ